MPSSSFQNAGKFAFGSCGALLGESNFFSTEGDDDDISKVERKLSWRGEHAFSDWTIIVTTSEVDSRTYHVHKSILSVGPRSSRYFSKLFLKEGSGRDSHRYNQSQSTKIELDEQDADTFPLFLDFMYDIAAHTDATSDDESLTLNVDHNFFTTSNAVSLRHLAKLFDCEGLMMAVNKFIKRNLSYKTGPVYLLQAHIYQDDRLIESAKRLCIENFSRLDTRAITRLPLELFRSIMTAVIERSKKGRALDNNINNPEEEKVLSYHLSEVVCQYFEKHPDRMNVQLLLELTNESVMPKIASEPAVGFTALVRELNPNDIKGGDSDEWRGLVALCQRCAHAVIGEYGWKDFNVTSALEEYIYGPTCCATNNNGSSSSSSKLDSLLFATSFAAALDRAQNDYQTNINNHGSTTTTTSSSKKQIEQFQKQNEDLQWQNRGMKKEVDRYKDALAGTKDELLQLRQQVKELKNRQFR
jgi:hypothetical protein